MKNNDYIIIHGPDGMTYVSRDGVMRFEPNEPEQQGGRYLSDGSWQSDEERAMENQRHYAAIAGE